MGGFLAGRLWQVVAIGLAVALLGVGLKWHEAAAARDVAASERDAANVKVGQLTGAITRQNQAIETMEAETKSAKEKYEVAQAVAKKASKKASDTLAELEAMKKPGGLSCTDAMPEVNKAIGGSI